MVRMPSKTQVLFFEDGFVECAVSFLQADLNIPGLQRTNLDLTSVEKTSQAVLLLAYLSGTQETKAL